MLWASVRIQSGARGAYDRLVARRHAAARRLQAAARAEGAGVVVVSRASSPAPPTHRRRYSRGHGYEFDASMGVVVGGGGGGDAVAEGGRVDATPPPPPTPAGEREDGTGEVTADVVVAVNVPDGRL